VANATDGSYKLTCVDGCPRCNQNDTVCGVDTTTQFLDSNGIVRRYQTCFDFQSGKYANATLCYEDVLSEYQANQCIMSVNGVACQSCQYQERACGVQAFFGLYMMANCTNVPEIGYVVDDCTFTDVDGIVSSFLLPMIMLEELVEIIILRLLLVVVVVVHRMVLFSMMMVPLQQDKATVQVVTVPIKPFISKRDFRNTIARVPVWTIQTMELRHSLVKMVVNHVIATLVFAVSFPLLMSMLRTIIMPLNILRVLNIPRVPIKEMSFALKDKSMMRNSPIVPRGFWVREIVVSPSMAWTVRRVPYKTRRVMALLERD
jgi:hypothetical protein